MEWSGRERERWRPDCRARILAAACGLGRFGRRTTDQREKKPPTHEQKLEEALRQTRRALIQSVHVMSVVLGRRDDYTARHQRHVAALALAIGRELRLESHRLDGLYLGALVHDVGKVAIPVELLTKPGRLTPEEFSLVKTHVKAGCEILEQVDLPWPVQAVVGQHHERLDGSGYPAGLSGEKIVLEARITAVADVFQAIREPRPYRPALGEEFALAELDRGAGVTFDRESVRALHSLVTEAQLQRTDIWTHLESEEVASTVVLPVERGRL